METPRRRNAANDCASAVERERNVKMIIALLFLIFFAILFPGALRLLFALLFIGGIIALGEAHASEIDKSKAMARHWDIVNNDCRTSGRLGTGSCAERDKLDILLVKRGCTYIGYDAPIGKRDRYRCAE
jgi:hypothetical protein